jgi:quercetin dioxygenase-like cupin family protein
MLVLKKPFNSIKIKPVSFLIASQKARSLLRPSILCLGLSLFCITANSEDWVPVYEEPKHQLVFENDQVMILNVDLPPGYVSLYHKHQIDLLYVTLSGTKVWAQPLGEEKHEADVKTGDLRFSSDNQPMPYIHRVGNIGTSPFHVVGIGIKNSISSEIEPLEGNTEGMELVDEKPHAGVYHISLKPGEQGGLHKHNLPFTLVYLSEGTLRYGEDNATAVKAGEFLWHDGGADHQLENMGDETIDIVVMQSR